MKTLKQINNKYTLNEPCVTCSKTVLFRDYEECQDCKKTICQLCYKSGFGRCSDCQAEQVAAVQAWAATGGSYADLMLVTKTKPVNDVIFDAQNTKKCSTCGVKPACSFSSDCVDCYTPGEPEDLQETKEFSGPDFYKGREKLSLVDEEFSENRFLMVEHCTAVSDYYDRGDHCEY